jgi:hypothetical protein
MLTTGQDPDMGTIQDAVVERVSGDRPSRVKSAFAAVAVGFTTAVVAYRLLRSGGDGSQDAADGTD